MWCILFPSSDRTCIKNLQIPSSDVKDVKNQLHNNYSIIVIQKGTCFNSSVGISWKSHYPETTCVLKWDFWVRAYITQRNISPTVLTSDLTIAQLPQYNEQLRVWDMELNYLRLTVGSNFLVLSTSLNSSLQHFPHLKMGTLMAIVSMECWEDLIC